MFCFINLTPQTPPSVIHGWKATDLLYDMVKTKKYFFHPVRRQIFGDALKQTFCMISKLVLLPSCIIYGAHLCMYARNVYSELAIVAPRLQQATATVIRHLILVVNHRFLQLGPIVDSSSSITTDHRCYSIAARKGQS